MSLCRLALRLAAVRALRGNTLVGDNVLDSENGILTVDSDGNLIAKESSRFIAVYTDDSLSDDGNHRWFSSNGKVTLRFEAGISSSMEAEEDDPDNPGRKIKSVLPGIPNTDEASELYLDILDRQIMTALRSEQSPAADIFRGLIMTNLKIERRAALSQTNGQRIAARQIAVTVELINDPLTLADCPDTGPMSKLLLLLDSEGDRSTRLANMIRAELSVDADGDGDIQSRLGLTNAEFEALGYGALDPGGELPEMSAVELEATGHGTETIS